jgi:hypothetical protein
MPTNTIPTTNIDNASTTGTSTAPTGTTTNDTEAPGITLNGDQTINLNIGDTYTEQGATAFDTVDGDISSTITTTGTVDTNTAATYEIIYTAVDAAGNIASKARTIIVNEVVAQTPIATDTASSTGE